MAAPQNRLLHPTSSFLFSPGTCRTLRGVSGNPGFSYLFTSDGGLSNSVHRCNPPAPDTGSSSSSGFGFACSINVTEGDVTFWRP